MRGVSYGAPSSFESLPTRPLVPQPFPRPAYVLPRVHKRRLQEHTGHRTVPAAATSAPENLQETPGTAHRLPGSLEPSVDLRTPAAGAPTPLVPPPELCFCGQIRTSRALIAHLPLPPVTPKSSSPYTPSGLSLPTPPTGFDRAGTACRISCPGGLPPHCL